MTQPAPAPTPIAAPRAILLEDVQRMIGALTIENDSLRRENQLLRTALEEATKPKPAEIAAAPEAASA